LSSKIDEIYHPSAKGTEVELNWIGLLKDYLPERYKVDSGFIIDHKGNLSEQIDIIIYDRHYTPFIFKGKSVVFIPAEGVYAIFEVKPKLNKKNFNYAVKKLNSVEKLQRTSAKFKHISGEDKKELFNIIGGILTKEIGSNTIYNKIDIKSKLSFIMCLDKGIKVVNNQTIEVQEKDTILSFFLLKLIEKLRGLATVPALDVDKYLSFNKKKAK
jgi:hypothetical protein